jgi:hypothetical protein
MPDQQPDYLSNFDHQPYMNWEKDVDQDAERVMFIETLVSFYVQEMLAQKEIKALPPEAQAQVTAAIERIALAMAIGDRLVMEMSIQQGVEMCADKSGLRGDHRAADRRFALFGARGNPIPARGV